MATSKTKTLLERIVREEYRSLNEQSAKPKIPGGNPLENALNNGKNLQRILDKWPGVTKNSIGMPATISYDLKVKWLNLPINWENNVSTKIGTDAFNAGEHVLTQLEKNTSQLWTITPADYKGELIANVNSSTFKYKLEAQPSSNKIIIKTLSGTSIYELTPVSAWNYMYKGNKFFKDIDALIWTVNPKNLSDIEKMPRFIDKNPKKLKEKFHALLDVIGFIPVVGSVADFTNALIYFVEGRNTEAFLSLIAVNPLMDIAKVGTKSVLNSIGIGSDAIKAFPKTQDSGKLIKWWRDYIKTADPDVIKTLGNNISKRKKLIRDILNKTPPEQYAEVYAQIQKFEDELLSKIQIITPGGGKSIDFPTFLEKIGAKTPEAKRGVAAFVGAAADASSVTPYLNLVPTSMWAKLLGTLTPAGTLYQKFLSGNLSNMFNRKFSDPKFWEQLGTPILGQRFGELRKEARNLFKDTPDGKVAWETFSGRANAVKDLRSRILSKKRSLSTGTSGFQTAAVQQQRVVLQNELDQLKQQLQIQLRNRKQAWDYFDDQFVNSEIYEKGLGQAVAQQISETKIAEAFTNNIVNRFIAALNPKYMGNRRTRSFSASELAKTFGTEFAANILSLRKHIDLIYNEYNAIATEINRQTKSNTLPADPRAATESWLYDMIREKNGTIKRTSNSITNYFIDKLNAWITSKTEKLRDTEDILKRVDANQPGSEKDIAM